VNDSNASTSLSVMLIVSDAAEAAQWYEQALGAKVLWDLGGVAGLHIAGAPFFIHQAVPGRSREPSPSDVGMTTTRIEVFTDDADALVDPAAAFGATDVEPITDHESPWGNHRQSGFTDPFGHRWSVGDRTPLRNLANPALGP
jgi:PhnB protein